MMNTLGKNLFYKEVRFMKKKMCYLCALLMVIAVFVCESFSPATVNAASDTEASTYGFTVDSSKYKTSVWYNSITIKCKYDGHVVGVCTTKIGMTRATSKTSDSKYLDQVLIRNAMKGKNPVSNYAGYSEYLTVYNKIPSGMSLAAYSPESQSGMKSYTIGVEASTDKTAGISASTTVSKKALSIENMCDTSSRLFKIGYDYENNWFLPSGYDTYGKYSYNESFQRCHYTIKTAKSAYKLVIKVTPKFEVMNGTGYWTISKGAYCSNEMSIELTTPSF